MIESVCLIEFDLGEQNDLEGIINTFAWGNSMLGVLVEKEKKLRVRELNPGHPRDRRVY